MFAPPAHGGRTGHILFVRENTLMAAPFDAASAQLSGDVFPVAEGVSLTTDNSLMCRPRSQRTACCFTKTGGATGGTNQFGWFDRSGKSLGPVGAPGAVFDPALSPDEKLVVFRRIAAAGSDLWVRDLSRGTGDALHQRCIEQPCALLVAQGRPHCLHVESDRWRLQSLSKSRQRKRAR